MSWRLPAGRGSPCEICGKPMLASVSGRGYCLPCADPIDDIPLVPVSWRPKSFFRVKSAWERGVREYNENVRKWRLYLVPGSRPGSLRVVTEKREDPTEADELVVPRARTTVSRRASKAGGRPRKLTENDVKRLRRWVETPGFTTKLLAERFGTHPRTIRHYLKRLGLKLKRRPARQPMKRPARRSRPS
jgi:DNA-binding CsgD family transcriptional regulator